ncbi:MAG: serine--tRNA ligase [Candidatus Hodarchaeota archaeon]
MLDINLIRESPEVVRANLERRKNPEYLNMLDELISTDVKWRECRTKTNKLRQVRNTVSKEIRTLSGDEKKAKIQEMHQVNKDITELETQTKAMEEKRQYYLDRIPNLMHDSVPYGVDDTENVTIRTWGSPPEFDFKPKDHIDLMLDLDLLELERAAKTSGSRFYYLKNQAVFLDLALIRFAMDQLIKEGFTPFTTPVLVRKKLLYGTGFLPTGIDDIYKIEGEDLALIGTSEISLGGLHMDEVLEYSQLPLWYCGFSPCFRTEAGAHGRDTKGIFRVHKFHKVEMFKFCEPEKSWEEHEHMIKMAERVFRLLELPYRIVNICTGDLGVVAAKKYDLETWLPGQGENGKFREVVSCSNCTDYQARRLNARYRPKGSKTSKPEYVHTLNSTTLATNRAMIAILENNQQEDGSILIPKVLHPYTGFEVIALSANKK